MKIFCVKKLFLLIYSTISYHFAPFVYRLRDGLKFILNISRHGNQYIQANKPWVMVKGTEAEKERAGTVIGLATNVSALLCILMKPYMPEISSTLQAQLALSDDKFVIPDYFVPLLPTGHVAGTPAPLFQKLEAAFGEEMKKRFAGTRPETVSGKTFYRFFFFFCLTKFANYLSTLFGFLINLLIYY